MEDRQGRPQLRVQAIGAKGLRSADFGITGGSSDPYCTFNIVGRPQQRHKTKTIKKCLEPVWDFEGLLSGCGEGDAVEFEVWDYDAVGADDLLGKAVLEYEDFAAFGFEGEVPLTESGTKSAVLMVKLELLPELPVPADQPRAFVRVLSASGLKAADFGGKSDPYARVEIEGKPESRFQTKVMMKCLEPVWNEEDELRGFAEDDSILIQVYDYDANTGDDRIGKLLLRPPDFYPDGFMMQERSLEGGGKIKFSVELYVPYVPPVKEDPGLHVGFEDRQPAPFQLRSLDTNRTHRLVAYTCIGRSERHLDPRTDLILKNPGIIDVSRVHALIKCWPGADPNIWSARVYDDKGGAGAGFGPGGGHAGGGTTVDGEPVDPDVGTAIEPGCVLRFGINELWVVERAAIHLKSHLAEVSINKARKNAVEDPATFRSLKVPTAACTAALRHCIDWDSLVRVVLEWCGEPDEPPCVDIIEVADEIGKTVSRHVAATLEQQHSYQVGKIIQDVRMGCTLRLRLSSDPCLLAPILGHMELHRARLAEIHDQRHDALFGMFSPGQE